MKYLHKTGAKALVIRDGSILVQKKYRKKKKYYTLPGGTVEDGENLLDTLKRECLEEIDTEVQAGDLAFVFEHESKSRDGSMKKKIDLVFRATVPADYKPRNGPHPDPHQKDVVWLPLAKVGISTFKPVALGEALKALEEDSPEKDKHQVFWPQLVAWTD